MKTHETLADYIRRTEQLMTTRYILRSVSVMGFDGWELFDTVSKTAIRKSTNRQAMVVACYEANMKATTS